MVNQIAWENVQMMTGGSYQIKNVHVREKQSNKCNDHSYGCNDTDLLNLLTWSLNATAEVLEVFEDLTTVEDLTYVICIKRRYSDEMGQ